LTGSYLEPFLPNSDGNIPGGRPNKSGRVKKKRIGQSAAKFLLKEIGSTTIGISSDKPQVRLK